MKTDSTIKGYVYICSNPTYDNIVKVGMTTKDPRKRVKQLYNTSVPAPFQLEHYWTITNTTPKAFESSCHRHLGKYRVTDNREFFRISPDQAIAEISTMLNNKGRNYLKKRKLIVIFLFVILVIFFTTTMYAIRPVFMKLMEYYQ